MGDPTLIQPLDRLRERRLGHVEGQMMHATRIGRGAPRIGFAGLVGEDRDQPAIARIEVEMPFIRIVQVGLVEDERHAQHAFPEVDGCLAVRTGQRDVVHALCL